MSANKFFVNAAVAGRRDRPAAAPGVRARRAAATQNERMVRRILRLSSAEPINVTSEDRRSTRRAARRVRRARRRRRRWREQSASRNPEDEGFEAPEDGQLHGPRPHLAQLTGSGGPGDRGGRRHHLGTPLPRPAERDRQYRSEPGSCLRGAVPQRPDQVPGHGRGRDGGILAPCAELVRGIPGSLAEIAERGKAIVDGNGALRVSEFLVPTPAAELRLRRTTVSDAHSYYDWVNEAEVRRQSLVSERIPWEQHRQWFAASSPPSRAAFS